ncbi:hypothetical protein N7455_005331 [Penicillium solitum]|uniref:uncharacterized protein n=1 Tax=Penicillium solitum TaxID=60172 RepID=UPI0032C49F82|nr:hypothetical protein N7455_005331 [Penicillium solitum]
MASFDTNVDHSETRAAEINAIGWVFTGIAIAAVSLKLLARLDSKRFGWDDFFIFFSLALSIIATAFVSYSVTLGLGRHTATVVAEYGIERYEKSAYWQIVAFPFNIGAFSFPNISIAILIVHLLDPNPLRARLLLSVCIMMGLTLLSAIVTIVKATYLKLFTDHTDPLFKVVTLVLWGLIEQNVVIVAACIPTLRPLFRKVFKSTIGSTGEATSQKETGSGFKLSYNSLQRSKRTPSAAELPLKNIKQRSCDAESSNSQSGIWQTREVLVESDDDRSFERPHV